MKNLVFLLLLFFSLTLSSFAYGSGGSPCCIDFNFDQSEYSSGKTVIITVNGSQNYEKSNESVSITISDVTFGPDYVNIVYQDQKPLQDGTAKFEYKSPSDSDRYRYLVTVESSTGINSKMFFTKNDASKILISDIKVLNPTLKPGQPIRFEAKVVDGIGKPSHYLRILATGQIPQQLCSIETSNLAGAYLDVSPLYSLQPDYWSSGIIRGEIPILNTARPGTYDIILSAGGDIEGYQNERKIFPIIIEPSSIPKEPPYGVFAPREFKFRSGFMTEQPINITGITAYNECGQPIPHVPIKAELKRYDMQNSQWIETLQTKETTSDQNGTYNFYFAPIGLRTGYYYVLLTSSYQEGELVSGIGEMPHNIKKFTINEEGKEFTIPVDGWYFIPLNATFDKENKKTHSGT